MVGLPGPPHGPRRASLQQARALGALAVLGLVNVVLRGALAARAPAWFVEICVIRMSERPLARVIATAAADIHPPLQFLLRWAWAGLAGPGEAAQKALSILFSTLLLLPAWGIARRAFGTAAALLACALLVLNPLLIRYGQEIETNALQALLVLWLSYHALAWLDERRGRDAAGYAVAAALACWAEYLSLPIVALLGVLGAWCVRRERRALATWLALHALVALAFAPQVPTLLAQFAREGSGRYFHFPQPAQVLVLARQFGFDSFRTAAVLGLLAAIALWRAPARRTAWILLALGTLPLLGMRLWVAVPPRDVLYLLPPWLLLAAAGAANLPARWLRRGAAVVLLGLAALGARRAAPEAEGTTTAATLRWVHAAAAPGDVIVHAETHSLQFFTWHAPALRQRLLLPPGQHAVPFNEGGLVTPDSLLWTSAQFDSARRAGTRLWCVDLDRAAVSHGVFSRAGHAADSCFRAAGAESAWARAPITVRRLRGAGR